MASRSKKSSAPLTFDLPESLIAKINALRDSHGLDSASDVVRLAMDKFNFETATPATVPHRQISVRITLEQRALLKKYSKKKDASVGELLRLAIEGLAATPAKKKK